MSVPLDKQNIIIVSSPQKKKESVPALDPHWVEKVQFVSYQAPPVDQSDKGLFEEWCERLKFIEDDLHWMLQLAHDKFWCQAVFDDTFHKLIDTYLRYAPRSYDVIEELSDPARERHDEIHRLIFMCCLRLATHKESKDHYITPAVFGEILYENFIFDVPKLLDICVLYGGSNGPLVSKMVENIFTQQPKYNDDLEQTVNTLLQVFDNILMKCGIKDNTTGSPQKLGKTGVVGQDQLVTMETTEFQDVVYYISDTAVTLGTFLHVYPAASTVFHQTDFLNRLATFYDQVISEVFAALKQRELDMSTKMMLKQKMVQAKKSYLSLFQIVVSQCCIQPLLEKKGVAMDHVEEYLHIMSSVLGERRFLADYESLYSFQGDLEILSQSSCVDETRVEYIQDAVNHAFSTFGKRKAPKGAMNRGGRRSPDGSPGPLDDGAIGGAMGGATGGTSPVTPVQADTQQDLGEAGAPKLSGVELESLITSVKDLLPDLGEGFIELCLTELGYSTEQVINALLEDRLPPSLQGINRNMPREKRAPSPKLLVQERANVYDYDEFDVFHRDDVDTDRITIGKTSKTDKVSLDDHLTMIDLKDNISKDYGVVVDIKLDEAGGAYSRDLYDDEYDDTYDTNVVGADDADDADELTTRRPFTTPRVLGGGAASQRVELVSEESDTETDSKPRDQFVEDPAVLRARAEERHRSKFTKGQRPQPRSYDVKGGPKGQGQSSEVQRNRKFKTEHKGGNRRQLADKKRKV